VSYSASPVEELPTATQQQASEYLKSLYPTLATSSLVAANRNDEVAADGSVLNLPLDMEHPQLNDVQYEENVEGSPSFQEDPSGPAEAPAALPAGSPAEVTEAEDRALASVTDAGLPAGLQQTQWNEHQWEEPFECSGSAADVNASRPAEEIPALPVGPPALVNTNEYEVANGYLASAQTGLPQSQPNEQQWEEPFETACNFQEIPDGQSAHLIPLAAAGTEDLQLTQLQSEQPLEAALLLQDNLDKPTEDMQDMPDMLATETVPPIAAESMANLQTDAQQSQLVEHEALLAGRPQSQLDEHQWEESFEDPQALQEVPGRQLEDVAVLDAVALDAFNPQALHEVPGRPLEDGAALDPVALDALDSQALHEIPGRQLEDVAALDSVALEALDPQALQEVPGRQLEDGAALTSLALDAFHPQALQEVHGRQLEDGAALASVVVDTNQADIAGAMTNLPLVVQDDSIGQADAGRAMTDLPSVAQDDSIGQADAGGAMTDLPVVVQESQFNELQHEQPLEGGAIAIGSLANVHTGVQPSSTEQHWEEPFEGEAAADYSMSNFLNCSESLSDSQSKPTENLAASTAFPPAGLEQSQFAEYQQEQPLQGTKYLGEAPSGQMTDVPAPVTSPAPLMAANEDGWSHMVSALSASPPAMINAQEGDAALEDGWFNMASALSAGPPVMINAHEGDAALATGSLADVHTGEAVFNQDMANLESSEERSQLHEYQWNESYEASQPLQENPGRPATDMSLGLLVDAAQASSRGELAGGLALTSKDSSKESLVREVTTEDETRVKSAPKSSSSRQRDVANIIAGTAIEEAVLFAADLPMFGHQYNDVASGSASDEGRAVD